MKRAKKAVKATPRQKKALKITRARLRSDKPLSEHEQILARLDVLLAVVYEMSNLQETSVRRFFKNATEMIWQNHRSTKSRSKYLPEAIRGLFYR